MAQNQSLSGNYIETPNEYYLQVKQFGEFVDRFNYLSDFKGNLITEDFAQKFPRPKYISFLLNKEDSKNIEATYSERVARFINFVTNPENPKKINLYGGQVKAFAEVNFTYTGKPAKGTIELAPEILPDRSAKWVIIGITTDCFATIADSLTTHFLAPNSHETNFINIKKVSGNSSPIFFFPTTLAANPTLLFMTESAKGRIQVQNIEKVHYIIDFDNWQIRVEEFKRTCTNSGWLISNVYQTK
jgi:hypothetical protein